MFNVDITAEDITLGDDAGEILHIERDHWRANPQLLAVMADAAHIGDVWGADALRTLLGQAVPAQS